MTEVHVAFPANGGTMVTPQTGATIEGAQVFWRVESQDPLIRNVRIAFDDADAKFFCARGQECRDIVKPLTYVDGQAEAVIWGKAPACRLGDRRADKYSVEGLDADGARVAGLDPKILTVKP